MTLAVIVARRRSTELARLNKEQAGRHAKASSSGEDASSAYRMSLPECPKQADSPAEAACSKSAGWV